MFLIKSTLQLICIFGVAHSTPFELSNTSTWINYPLEAHDIKLAYDQWTWLSSITIKTKEPMTLQDLKLHWKGKPLKGLTAALYQKKELKEKTVIPLQDNVIAEGEWNTSRQELNFKLNQKIAGIGSYHLVVSYPKSNQKILKTGSFSVTQARGVNIKKCKPTKIKSQLKQKNT